MRAMETARDMNDSLKEPRMGGGGTSKSNNSSFRYQGGVGNVSRTETFKGTGNSQGSSSINSTGRKEGGGASSFSKTGSNVIGAAKSKGVRNLPYPEYKVVARQSKYGHFIPI